MSLLELEAIEKLEALAAATTPGEWVAQGTFRGETRVLTGAVVVNRHPSNHWPVVVRSPTEYSYADGPDPQAGADAAFIAAIHNAAPGLFLAAKNVAYYQHQAEEQGSINLTLLDENAGLAGTLQGAEAECASLRTTNARLREALRGLFEAAIVYRASGVAAPYVDRGAVLSRMTSAILDAEAALNGGE